MPMAAFAAALLAVHRPYVDPNLMDVQMSSQLPPLRASFFRHIARVGKFVGSAPCEAFLLPCVERCLSDSSDEVVAWALKCLAEMVGAGTPGKEHEEHATNGPALNDNEENETNDETRETSVGAIESSPNECGGSVLRRRSVVAAAQRAAPALCHPASAVRASARRFFAAAARFLGRADTFALLLPSVRPFLRDESRAALAVYASGGATPCGAPHPMSEPIRSMRPCGTRVDWRRAGVPAVARLLKSVKSGNGWLRNDAGRFKTMGYLKAMFTFQLLELGYDVLLSDADSVFLGDPWPWIGRTPVDVTSRPAALAATSAAPASADLAIDDKVSVVVRVRIVGPHDQEGAPAQLRAAPRTREELGAAALAHLRRAGVPT